MRENATVTAASHAGIAARRQRLVITAAIANAFAAWLDGNEELRRFVSPSGRVRPTHHLSVSTVTFTGSNAIADSRRNARPAAPANSATAPPAMSTMRLLSLASRIGAS